MSPGLSLSSKEHPLCFSLECIHILLQHSSGVPALCPVFYLVLETGNKQTSALSEPCLDDDLLGSQLSEEVVNAFG